MDQMTDVEDGAGIVVLPVFVAFCKRPIYHRFIDVEHIRRSTVINIF